jgi:C-terminal processing protease CtpA/Prc
VENFKSFIDSSFTVLKEKNINKLILDLRHNDGGDPFCSASLLSYLEKDSLVYFKKASRGYRELMKPVPRAENAYEGDLIVFMDSRCFSTNGHLCSLIKYHKLGTIIGKPSSGNYICTNSKRVDLVNSGIMVYYGSRGYATAVEMDRAKPIMPDIRIEETMESYLNGRDLYMEKAMEVFSKEQRAKG